MEEQHREGGRKTGMKMFLVNLVMRAEKKISRKKSRLQITVLKKKKMNAAYRVYSSKVAFFLFFELLAC